MYEPWFHTESSFELFIKDAFKYSLLGCLIIALLGVVIQFIFPGKEINETREQIEKPPNGKKIKCGPMKRVMGRELNTISIILFGIVLIVGISWFLLGIIAGFFQEFDVYIF